MNESRFLKHVGCPRCNSKDNLALYEGGSGWCFGCGYYQKPKGSPYGHGAVEQGESGAARRPLQSYEKDFGPPSDEIISWLNKYGVTLSELESRQGQTTGPYLRFNFYATETRGIQKSSSTATGNVSVVSQNSGEELLLSQTRYFPSPGSEDYQRGRRFFTKGKVDTCIPIYYARNPRQLSRTLVIVEDCISAIKIARFNDAMPCMSSDLSRDKLRRLNRLYGAFLIWLDADMYPKAQRIAQRLELLGAQAKAVWTEHDPKVYQNDELKTIVAQGG